MPTTSAILPGVTFTDPETFRDGIETGAAIGPGFTESPEDCEVLGIVTDAGTALAATLLPVERDEPGITDGATIGAGVARAPALVVGAGTATGAVSATG